MMSTIPYKRIIFLILALILLILWKPAKAEAPTPTLPIDTRTLIAYGAKDFDVDPVLIDKIIFCESGYKVLPHDGGRAVNMTGIHNTTFKVWLPQYEKERNETLDMYSPLDQVKMMAWAFSKGYGNHWTTYRAYKNGGTYTFYSKMLKTTFTSRCK